MSDKKKLYITFLEPDFGLKIEEIARSVAPRALLPEPVAFFVGDTEWYLRSIEKLGKFERDNTMAIRGSGTHELSRSDNDKVLIKLDLRSNAQSGSITFTP